MNQELWDKVMQQVVEEDEKKRTRADLIQDSIEDFVRANVAYRKKKARIERAERFRRVINPKRWL